MEQLPPSVVRKTSLSSGISYLCSGSLQVTPQRLYVCFHGWACAARDYALLLSTLASYDESSSRHNLYIALDLPGHGDSPKSTCPHPNVPAYAKVANDLRQELSPDGRLLDTVLVGHSMGCRMAIEALVQEPIGVSSLILLDGSWTSRKAEVHAAPVLEDREKEIERISARIEFYGPLTPESFKQDMKRRLKEIDLGYEYELGRSYIEWDRVRMEGALEEVAKDSNAKVLVIQSTQGRGSTRRVLKSSEEGTWLPFVRDKLESGRFQGIVIEDCGHWPHVDKVEEVAKTILDFQVD